MNTILIIEDEENVRHNLEDLLQSEGFRVLSASNGKEGYDIAVSEDPELILSDIRMPVLNGLDLLKKLQENSATSLIPFIFITAKNDTRDVRLGMSAGADDYLTKPFGIEDLLKAINSRLKKRKIYLDSTKEFKNILTRKVPHELRTPLVPILGLSEILGANIDTLTTDEIIKISETIQGSGKRLYRRIEKFLVYSELLSIKNDLKLSSESAKNSYEVESNELIEKLLLKAKEFNRYSDLNIRFEEGIIKAYKWQLEVLLVELLENAIKYSRKGSPINITGIRDEQHYKITIKDCGIGMENLKKNTIQVFNQLGRENQTEEGMGFGLAIVKKVVELSAGYLKFNSKVNEFMEVEVGFLLNNCLKSNVKSLSEVN